MERLRFAHLSDLHLTPNNRMSRSESKLFGKLKGMNMAFQAILKSKQLKGVDWLIVSGDVTDRGDLDSWHFFWEAITKEGYKDRCLVIPGNHDVCNLGVGSYSKKETEREAYDRINRMRRGLALGGQQVKFPWARLIDNDIVIFGLDSSNSGNKTAITNAKGHLGFPQLESLARLLKKYDRVPIKMILLHHSPNIPHMTTECQRGLPPTSKLARWGHEVPQNERQGLRLLAITHGVQLILHGHLHREESRRVNGIRIVGTDASTELTKKKNSVVKVYDVYKKSKRIFSRHITLRLD